MQEKKPLLWLFLGGVLGGLGAALANDLNDILKSILPGFFQFIWLGGFHVGIEIIIAIVLTLMIILVSFYSGMCYLPFSIFRLLNKEKKYVPLRFHVVKIVGDVILFLPALHSRWQQKRNPPPPPSEHVQRVLQLIKEEKGEQSSGTD